MFKLTLTLIAGIGAALFIGGRDLTDEEIAEIERTNAAQSGALFTTNRTVTRNAVKPVPVSVSVMDSAEPAVSAQNAEQVQAVAAPAVDEAAVLAAVQLAMGNAAAEPAAEPELAEVAAPATVEEETEVALTAHKVWYVTASKVNVRSGPSTDYSVVDQVVFGEATEVLSDTSEEWVRIRIEGDGVEGFIATRFLQDSEPNG